MNWMSILGLCLIVLGTIFSFFGTSFSDEKGQKELTDKIQEKNKVIDQINLNNIRLIDQNTSLIESNTHVSENNKELLFQNTSLIKSNSEVSGNNKGLLNQNTEMLNKIAKYQNDIEERNRKIQELESQVDNVKKYNFFADMDITGRNMSTPDGNIVITTGITILMDKILDKTDNNYVVKSDASTLTLINEVIKKFPDFPFGYYTKAIYLRTKKKEDWKISANKAIEILEVTTKINGHHLNQDQALKELKTYLGKK